MHALFKYDRMYSTYRGAKIKGNHRLISCHARDPDSATSNVYLRRNLDPPPTTESMTNKIYLHIRKTFFRSDLNPSS